MNEILCGAGILPFSVSDTGELLFLLGKEQSIQNWKGSERWSAFEGGTKDGENSMQNACREFAEETIHCLIDESVEQIEDELARKDYAIKFCLSIQNMMSSKKTHVTYVKQFGYKKNVEKIFAEKLNFLKYMLALQKEFDNVKFQKSDIHPFHKLGDIIHIQSKQCKVVDIECIQNDVSKFFTVDLTLCDEDGQRLCLSSTHEMNWQAREYINWYKNQREIRHKSDDILNMKREIELDADPHGNFVHFKVNVDFMEKSVVRYWTVDDLKLVVEKKGLHGEEAFRPYFMYVLRETLSMFSGNAAALNNQEAFIKVQEDIHLF